MGDARDAVLLFESDGGDEALRVECTPLDDGGLLLLQESDGDLTSWSFGESPHRIEVEVPASGVRALSDRAGLDEVSKLPFVLQMEYTGYDCLQRICAMLRRAEVPYRVQEVVPVR